MRKYLKPGTRVTYTYLHHAGRSSWYRTLHGAVVRTVKHRNPFYRQEVAVLFDGNKSETKVFIDSIEIERPKDQRQKNG